MTARETILVVPQQLDFAADVLAERYDVLRGWTDIPAQRLASVRALVCMGHHPLPDLDTMQGLGLVACFTTGYEALDVPALQRRGLVVSHAPGVAADPVAEFALGLILAANRRIVEGHDQVTSGRWGMGPAQLGRAVAGRKLGIVGLGDIGLALAAKASALGMIASWWGPRAKPHAPYPRHADLLDLARNTNVLAVCARSTAENRHLINAEVIDAVGADGLIVNVSRGHLVDEDALRQALSNGRLGAAALDVFAEEPTQAALWQGVPNIVLTPHIAGATRENAQRMTTMMLDNVDRFFSGQEVANPIPG